MSSVRLPYYGFRRVRSSGLSRSSNFSCSYPRSRRVVQRLNGHRRVHPVAEDQHLYGGAGGGELRREVGKGDGARDGVTDGPAGDAPDGLAAYANGLVAEDGAQRVGEREACEAPGRLRVEGGAADVRLVRADAEAEPRLVRRLVGGDVAPPVAIALLGPQRVDRLVAARQTTRRRHTVRQQR